MKPAFARADSLGRNLAARLLPGRPLAVSEHAAAAILPPSLALLAAEIGSVMGVSRRLARSRAQDCSELGDGPPVMVIPGFLASNSASRQMRARLNRGGYHCIGWADGLNLGARVDTLERLVATIEPLVEQRGPVSLVGWSLGGLFAREVAKLRPDLVDRVVTLGTPFSGNPRANRAWRLYERIAGHPVDRPPLDVRLTEKPPVPTWAMWSARDGIVAPACARGRRAERDHAVELDCLHMTFLTDPHAIGAVAAALAA